MVNEVVPRDAARLDGNEWLSEVLHRPGGRWIAKLAFPTFITPNQLTFMGGFLGIVAGTLLIIGAEDAVLRASGGFVLWVSCLFDCADGELARARKLQSPLGMMLDGLMDNVIGTSVFVGMAYNVVVYFGTPWAWLLGIAAGVSIVTHVWLYDARKKQYLQCIGLHVPDNVEALTRQRLEAREQHNWFDFILLTAYEFFRGAQSLGTDTVVAREPVRFRQANRLRMRAWTLMGSSMHFVALYTAAFVSIFWPPAILACVLYFTVVLNVIFAVLLLGKWKQV